MSHAVNSQSTLFDLRPGLRLFGAVVSFEAVFILFLASVIYKLDPRLSSIAINLTLIFLVPGIAMGLAIVYREGIYLPGLTLVSLFLVFVVWVMITNLWTPSKVYAPEKLRELATLNLWCLIAAGMIIANRRERLRRFLVLLLVFATAASVDGIIQYARAENFALSAIFRLENYISSGRFYGMGALVAFAAWLQTSPFSRRGMALMAAFVICGFALLVAGARGPILGVLAGMTLPLALGLRFASRRLFASKALVAGIVLFVAMAAVLLEVAASYAENIRAVQTFNTLFLQEEGGASAAARWEFWRGSWHLWLQRPLFGSGIGSWPVLYHGIDVGRHPHNLILEVLVEFGFVGLLLLAAVVLAAARRTSVRRLREDPLLMCAAMLCISMFLSAMTSSDITGNRHVFAMLGLLMMRPYGRTSHIDSDSRARALGRPAQRGSSPSHQMPIPGGSGA
jgi:O-antigen ligase